MNHTYDDDDEHFFMSQTDDDEHFFMSPTYDDDMMMMMISIFS